MRAKTPNSIRHRHYKQQKLYELLETENRRRKKREHTHTHIQKQPKSSSFIPKDDFIIYCVWKFTAAYRHQTVVSNLYTVDFTVYVSICVCVMTIKKRMKE